jgi:hypothetical protein
MSLNNAETRKKATVPVLDAKPNWVPLRKVVYNRVDEFIHMGRVESLELYKHASTRRYINIDRDTLKCYAYHDGFYVCLATKEAIAHVFDSESNTQRDQEHRGSNTNKRARPSSKKA